MNGIANRKIWHLQEEAAKLPQLELPTFHYRADGMYARVVSRPAGTLVVGKVHRREHFYIVTKGRVEVSSGEGSNTYEAGDVIVSQPGTKRAVLALEDSICMTVHRTDKHDLDEIERELIEDDPTSLFDSGNKLKDREDYARILDETGFTHYERRAISESRYDQITMPAGYSVAFLPSQIEGIGVFTTKAFSAGDEIAPARIGRMRTPVGRFLNHSVAPNADGKKIGDDIIVFSIREIGYNEEVTVDYRKAMIEARK